MSHDDLTCSFKFIMTEHSPGFCECLETPPLFVSNGVERKKTPGNSGDLVGVKM